MCQHMDIERRELLTGKTVTGSELYPNPSPEEQMAEGELTSGALNFISHTHVTKLSQKPQGQDTEYSSWHLKCSSKARYWQLGLKLILLWGGTHGCLLSEKCWCAKYYFECVRRGKTKEFVLCLKIWRAERRALLSSFSKTLFWCPMGHWKANEQQMSFLYVLSSNWMRKWGPSKSLMSCEALFQNKDNPCSPRQDAAVQIKDSKIPNHNPFLKHQDQYDRPTLE